MQGKLIPVQPDRRHRKQGIDHSTPSLLPPTLERRSTHQTPTTSTNPTQSRFQTPYLETPACLGLWLTGQGDMRPPWAWIRAGM